MVIRTTSLCLWILCQKDVSIWTHMKVLITFFYVSKSDERPPYVRLHRDILMTLFRFNIDPQMNFLSPLLDVMKYWVRIFCQ